jgi:hypothetical protein
MSCERIAANHSISVGPSQVPFGSLRLVADSSIMKVEPCPSLFCEIRVSVGGDTGSMR